MSGSTVRTLTDAFYELTMSTPCLDFAIDREMGESPEQAYHAEAAKRFDRTLRAIRQPVADGLRDLVKTLGLESEIVPFDAALPEVYDWGRRAFLEEGALTSGTLESIVRSPRSGLPRSECEP